MLRLFWKYGWELGRVRKECSQIDHFSSWFDAFPDAKVDDDPGQEDEHDQVELGSSWLWTSGTNEPLRVKSAQFLARVKLTRNPRSIRFHWESFVDKTPRTAISCHCAAWSYLKIWNHESWNDSFEAKRRVWAVTTSNLPFNDPSQHLSVFHGLPQFFQGTWLAKEEKMK